MVNQRVVTNCSTDFKTGQKEDQKLKRKCFFFVNCKDVKCRCTKI